MLRPWLLGLTLLLPHGVTAGEETDIAVIERHILTPLHESTGRRLSYPGSEHLTAARTLIAAGNTAQALASLDAWLDLEYRNSNWWVNHVPIPRAVGEIALLLRDAQLLKAIFARAAAEIRITTKEGIQEDLSFHQHGPQFYSGSAATSTRTSSRSGTGDASPERPVHRKRVHYRSSIGGGGRAVAPPSSAV